MRYPQKTIESVRKLRSIGKTYGEIQKSLNIQIPKSSLSWICKDVQLPKGYHERIDTINLVGLAKARSVAKTIRIIKREEFFASLRQINTPIAKKINSVENSKIALAMLCLGEASKYNPKHGHTFALGNTDPRIIILFLGLLKKCFVFDPEKIRATVQCRADQNPIELQKYWHNVTKIPDRLFYKPLVDPRTKGKPTKKSNYHGVLRIDYMDTKIQLELESLADLVYNRIHSHWARSSFG